MSARGWAARTSGVVALPSGLLVHGCRLSEAPDAADLTLVLGRGPMPRTPCRRLAWPDFWLPLDRADALDALQEAYVRAASGERVQVACRGGVGRTGTALAALTIIDGLAPDAAVAWVRERYHPRAVETPWQRRWLRHVRPAGPRVL